MPVIGASISFTTFTDEITMFHNKDEVNTFFQDIRVPVGTSSTYGTFKQSASISYTTSPCSNASFAQIQLDDVNLVECPTMTNFNELKAAFLALQTSYESLLTKLRNAQIISL